MYITKKGTAQKKKKSLMENFIFCAVGLLCYLSSYILTGFLGDSKGEIALMKS